MEKQKGTLAITRKEGEKLIIETKEGEVITVGLSSIQGSQAKLFITADKSVSILREELVT
jgi:sRNA-binding carbon storage regulator CsrA